jgi:serine/threonine protein kinase
MGVEDVEDPRFGRIVGTADYLSPEHINAPTELQPASDIYSLGCTLYYAVTGKVPFPGGTHRDKARRHCQDIPLNPRRFNGELTDDFIDVIAAMMEKEPKKRLATTDEVIRRLAPWAKDAVRYEVNPPSATGELRPVVPSLSDTEPGLFDDLPSADESPSQLSQPTDPVAQAAQETVPDFNRAPGFIPEDESSSWLVAAVVIVPLILAAGVLVVSVVLKAVL